jgi:uncharacterized protein YaeQ
VDHWQKGNAGVMVRLLAFALHTDDALEFGRGLSTDAEPDVWRRDLTGAIERWICGGKAHAKNWSGRIGLP